MSQIILTERFNIPKHCTHNESVDLFVEVQFEIHDHSFTIHKLSFDEWTLPLLKYPIEMGKSIRHRIQEKINDGDFKDQKMEGITEVPYDFEMDMMRRMNGA